MANVYYAHITDKVKGTSKIQHIVADSFHDAYGLARGVCRNAEEVETVSLTANDVIVCPQVAADAAKRA